MLIADQSITSMHSSYAQITNQKIVGQIKGGVVFFFRPQVAKAFQINKGFTYW